MKCPVFRYQGSFYCHIIFFHIILYSSMSGPLIAQTVLVTGGAGFIGSHVTSKLLERGDTVVIVDTFISLADASSTYNQKKRSHLKQLVKRFHTNLILYEVDIDVMENVEPIFIQHKIDIICHLAARAGVRASIENPVAFLKTNVIGTVNILELARKYNIAHCVLASSSSVYGASDRAPFVETQQTDKQNSVYGVSKKTVELLAYAYHHLYGISCSCLRFFTVYGPWARLDMAPFLFMDAIHNGRPITVYGDGTAVRDFTYIDDIVEGIICAIDKPYGFEIFNLGSTNRVVLSDFIKTIENTVGKKANIIYEQMFVADVLLTHADATKAQEMLGYKPEIDVIKGIKNMYEWYCMFL
jgi:UDP-glucuronate 4-epimerase